MCSPKLRLSVRTKEEQQSCFTAEFSAVFRNSHIHPGDPKASISPANLYIRQVLQAFISQGPREEPGSHSSPRGLLACLRVRVATGEAQCPASLHLPMFNFLPEAEFIFKHLFVWEEPCVWVPGIKLGSSGLAAGSFPC